MSLDFICPWENPVYLFFSSNIPFLLPYSHFLAVIAAATSAFFVFKVKKHHFGKIFLVMSIAFSLWVLFDWHIWATNNSSVVMFLWSIQIFLELLVYFSALFLTYNFAKDRTIPIAHIILSTLLLLPVVLALPTKFILKEIDISICDATENPLIIYYSYIIESIIILSIIRIIGGEVLKKSRAERSALILFGLGIITFLLGFTSGNIIGSITENWTVAQFGLFGMPIFLGILSYTVLKYKTIFNAKIITAQVLVIILWLLTAGILFLRTIERVRIITSITLLLVMVLGYFLTRSVKREVEQRERIEKLARDLEVANEKLKELDQMKTEFLSLATHQIRSPLTAIKGYSSMLLEGDFGEMPIKARGAVKTVFASCQHLIDIVEDFLNISRIEQGRMVYNKENLNLKDLVKEATTELMPNAEKKGLRIDLQITDQTPLIITADKNKMKQVLHDLIDNAIKYTKTGGIEVRVLRDQLNAEVVVKDTGVGMDKKDMDRLFNKFSRATDAFKQNVTGTGLGLYIAQKMTEAHGGKIQAESQGRGKGSTFTIVLPLARG